MKNLGVVESIVGMHGVLVLKSFTVYRTMVCIMSHDS